jgi:hypothetical protein
VLFQDHPLVIFLVCAVMFHFANAAMLPLLKRSKLFRVAGRRQIALPQVLLDHSLPLCSVLRNGSSGLPWKIECHLGWLSRE